MNDDVEAHVRLSAALGTRIATGQSMTTHHEIQPLLEPPTNVEVWKPKRKPRTEEPES